MNRFLVVVSVLFAMTLGCGGDAGSGVDSGLLPSDAGELADAALGDAGESDAAVDDAGESDAAIADAGESDAGATDAGMSSLDGGGSCAGEATGRSCGDTGGGDCPPTYMCDLGRCIPQGRETCGGFAGAPCPDTGHTVCLYETGHGDVGTCFSPTEAACLCDVASAMWSCG